MVVSTVMPQMGSIALVLDSFIVLLLFVVLMPSILSSAPDPDREAVAVPWGVTPMRTSDHHDGDGTLDAEGEVFAHQSQPNEQGDRATTQRHNGEPKSGGIREVLGFRFTFLGLFDQVNDLRQKRIFGRTLGVFLWRGVRALAYTF